MATESKDDHSGRWLTEEDYARYREALQRSEDVSSDEFDKVMVSLSGGALAISITFINQIAPEPKNFYLCIAAWVSFAIAMTCTLISFRTTQEAMREQAIILERVLNEGSSFGVNKWDIWTKRLNNCSLITFVMGVALLILFVSFQ